MSFWSVAAALGFGGMLAITAAIQPGRWSFRRRVKARDPCFYIPLWTFFAPDPNVTDWRLLWREQLVDGTVGPWHETVPPRAGARRSIWNPTKRARKAVFDCSSMVTRAGASTDDRLGMLSLPYLMIVQHVLGPPASPLGSARQFALVTTQGVDDEDGLFELKFVSPWHRLPGASPGLGVGTSEPPKLVETAA